MTDVIIKIKLTGCQKKGLKKHFSMNESQFIGYSDELCTALFYKGLDSLISAPTDYISRIRKYRIRDIDEFEVQITVDQEIIKKLKSLNYFIYGSIVDNIGSKIIRYELEQIIKEQTSLPKCIQSAIKELTKKYQTDEKKKAFKNLNFSSIDWTGLQRKDPNRARTIKQNAAKMCGISYNENKSLIDSLYKENASNSRTDSEIIDLIVNEIKEILKTH